MNLPAPPNNAGRTPEWGALRDLAPHLWPAGEFAVRARVLLALALLAGSKLATVYVPMLFKRMVDLFADPHNIADRAAARPGGRLRRCCASRRSRSRELRDAVFAKVAQRAIRTVALQTFRHLHSLSLALPSRAANRRAVARDRARHDRHRHVADVHAVQHRADADRDRCWSAASCGPSSTSAYAARHVRLRDRLHRATRSRSPSGASSTAAR